MSKCFPISDWNKKAILYLVCAVVVLKTQKNSENCDHLQREEMRKK